MRRKVLVLLVCAALLAVCFWQARQPVTLLQRVQSGDMTPRAICQPEGETYGKVWVCAEASK